MVQKVMLRNEVIKVKGRVKVITVNKEDFFKVLKLTKLRVLDKEYEVLMPPIDSLQKNTIDINGLATFVQQYLSNMFFQSGSTNASTPAQMVLNTPGGNINLSYTNNININSQGVTVYLQVLNENGNWTFQYYYVGFDTTNSSYTTSQLELYVSSKLFGESGVQNLIYYTDLIRIAYSSMSFTKTSDSYLFIVWLIEFQNIPPYLVGLTPIMQNNVNIYGITVPDGSSFIAYFNNGNCNFTCGGNCASAGLGGFITYINNNSIIVEFPITSRLGAGVLNLQVLFCGSTYIYGVGSISGSTSATLTSPVSGATFYVAIATITITYQGS